MKLMIRAETPSDYRRIAEINVHAFENRADEASMVALQRNAYRFDPELSLVAEADGDIIGHALFSPLLIRLLDQDLKAVLLGPISVDPAYQGRGIGAQLMQEGHRIASAKDYALSCLVGHPSYYPRFGYQTHAFGSSSIRIETPAPSMDLEARAPLPQDIPALTQLWRHEEGSIDFSMLPGPSLTDWLSTNLQIKANVYIHHGSIVGYTRIRETESASPLIFLAQNHEAAQSMAAQIGAGQPSLTLPLHPRSASAGAFVQQPSTDSWEAAMALPLQTDLLDTYFTQVKAGERPVGRVIFPVGFDIG